MVLSIDTEQIWGYLDSLNEAQFEARFPNTRDAHETLLTRLCAAGVSATWFVVGGLVLRDCAGAGDGRISGLVPGYVRIPQGGEESAPLWYCREFLDRLRAASPMQEIGLHGGLTHLVWTDARSTRQVVRRELIEGVDAIAQLSAPPRSFSYPRNREAHHDLLPPHGLRCFRGAPPTLAWRLGRTIPGAILRAWEELRNAVPPPVWPYKALPNLWSVPASMFLYPIGAARARVIGIRSRVERFRRGLEAAVRHGGVFHFCFHPENLAEAPSGFSLLDEILENLVQARSRGEIEVLTLSDVVDRIERQPYDWHYSELLEVDRRS